MLNDGEGVRESQSEVEDNAPYDFDLFVIGAGSGGVRAARFSAKFGAKDVRNFGWELNEKIEYSWKKLLHEKSVLGIILGGGAGTRLYQLTKKRAKPAVPLGANYGLVEMSNCLNSNVFKIYVLTHSALHLLTATFHECMLVTWVATRMKASWKFLPFSKVQRTLTGFRVPLMLLDSICGCSKNIMF